jgi:hypothetical protein
LLFSAVSDADRVAAGLLRKFQDHVSSAKLQSQAVTEAVAEPLIKRNLPIASTNVSGSHVIRGLMDRSAPKLSSGISCEPNPPLLPPFILASPHPYSPSDGIGAVENSTDRTCPLRCRRPSTDSSIFATRCALRVLLGRRIADPPS